MLNKSFWSQFFEYFTEECKVLYESKGFNYDIPKEEQIRASLYSFLKKKGHIMEVECNIFPKNPEKYQATPRFDLRVLSNDFDTLIELKRTTALDIWTNDFSNYLRSWEADIDKLDYLDDNENYDKWKIKNDIKKCFVLFIYTNNNEESDKLYNKLLAKINEFKEYVKDKWGNDICFESEFIPLGKYTYSSASPSSEKEAKVKLLVWWK